jgi:CheY-like chemotaxis protein
MLKKPVNESILLVDDDSLILWTTSSLLEREGYRVHSAQTIEEAVQALEQASPPSALITDYFLPDGTGNELIRLVRDAVSGDLPVIVMTGAPPSDVDSTQYPPNCRMLTKPVHFEVLRSELQRLMSSRNA